LQPVAAGMQSVCSMENQLPSERRTLVRLEEYSGKAEVIDALCINCNKRFKSMRAVSMHLRMTATRHAVNFINYGNYDKKTGLKDESYYDP
jgi:hypothetical protein